MSDNYYELETVRIQDGNGGFIIINKSDFDAALHKPFEDKPVKKQAKQGDA
jgi:hypothetical protein